MPNSKLQDTGRFLVEPTAIDGLCVIKLKPFIDHRGEFTRMYCQDEFYSLGLKKPIVQINKSRTKKSGSIRGMHFQNGVNAEDKVISCVAGRVFDVAVDMRPESATYLSWFGIELSENNHTSLLIPVGFAHGFQSLEDDSEIIYFVTKQYSNLAEDGLHPLDPKLNIRWPLPCADISAKDSSRPLLNQRSELRS
jgi:dTDP-4-dehydrorhamnose 3,5-epimerase